MSAVYNEFDPHAAQWLRNLIGAGLIAPGRVDERSIKEVTAEDIAGPGQRHYFAGIGVWSHALKRAYVRDDAPIWTGSCPCQPFSQAGHGRGVDDERHLWPEFFRLIAACRPPVVFLEQVANPAGLAWLDLVQDDLEGAGYTVWSCDLAAASVGAPHIRQRLYIAAIRSDVLDTRGWRNAGAVPRKEGEGFEQRVATRHLAHVAGTAGATGAAADTEHDHGSGRIGSAYGRSSLEPDRHRAALRLANPIIAAAARIGGPGTPRQPDPHGAPVRLADDDDEGRGIRRRTGLPDDIGQALGHDPDGRGAADFWGDCDWVYCRDGKWRPVERTDAAYRHGSTQPGVESLADVPAAFLDCVRAAGPLVSWDSIEGPKPSRGGLLKGYGNAIVGELAAEFIGAVLDTLEQG